MMNARTKSLLLLLTTLVVGLGVGALATGAAMNTRLDELQRLRQRGGFTERLEAVIAPTDEAQQAAVHAALERAHERFHADRRACSERFRASADSMRAELTPILSEDQRARLDAFLEEGWRDGRRTKERKRDRRESR